MPREEEQELISPGIISPTNMIDFRVPSLGLDLRNASDCSDMRIAEGVLKKRPGYAAYSIVKTAGGNLSGDVKGLVQTPFAWEDDIVALVQNGTSTLYYLYDTSTSKWTIKATIANTSKSQLSSTPAVTSVGAEVVILSDNLERLQVWAAAGTISNLGTTATLRAKALGYVNDHLVLFNVGTYADTTWTQSTRKVQWMNGTDITDDTGGDSGSNLILGRSGGEIVGAEMLGDDMLIYCKREIIMMTYVGGDTVFRFDTIVSERGLAAQNAIANLGERHLFLADDFTIREYSTGTHARPIGDPINSYIQANIHKTYYYNSFFVIAKGLNEAWLFFPSLTSSGVPDTVIVVKYAGTVGEFKWYKYSLTAFCAMMHDNWYVLAGGSSIINDFDYSSKDDGATKIDGWWNSISFKMKDLAQMVRHSYIHFEAKGDGVSVYYSTDEGDSWTPIETFTLTDKWAYYSAPFDSGYARSVQYRFRNNTSDETFELKWWQPVMLPAGGTR